MVSFVVPYSTADQQLKTPVHAIDIRNQKIFVPCRYVTVADDMGAFMEKCLLVKIPFSTATVL